ncbi:MAG: TonB-dependent receptor, partial [bacterium]|nr:TonB-dependent receptor [bacterium]
MGRIKEINMDDNDAPPGFSSTDLRNFGGGRLNSSDSELARDLMNNLVGAVEDVIERFNVTSLNSGFVPFAVERRKYRNNAVDLFINDSWRLRPGLTLNLGLRWEWAGVPVETEGLALNPEGNLLAGYGVSGPGGFFNPGTFDGTPCATLGQLPMTVSSTNARALIEDCATK